MFAIWRSMGLLRKGLLLTVYDNFFPRPPLSAFVECFWFYEGDVPSYKKERRLPDGSMELVINLRDDLLKFINCRDEMHNVTIAAVRGFAGSQVWLRL